MNLDRSPYTTDPEYGKNNYTATQRPEDLADFTYRELCFAIDHFYGLRFGVLISKESFSGGNLQLVNV